VKCDRSKKFVRKYRNPNLATLEADFGDPACKNFFLRRINCIVREVPSFNGRSAISEVTVARNMIRKGANLVALGPKLMEKAKVRCPNLEII